MTTDLEAKLDALDGASIVRPNADPQAAAMTALLVADWLGQRDVRDELAAAGVSRDAVEELRELSRLVLAASSHLGGEYLSDAKPVPGEILERGYGLRTQMLAKLEEGVHDDAIVVAWIEALKLGSGVVDLVYDLRTLAELHREHEAPLSRKNLTSGGLLATARSTADNIEYALREGEGADGARYRNTIARAWTLFAPGYERAAAAARKITRDAGAERKFPPLGLVASYRRGRRRAVSLVPMAPPPSAPQPPKDVVKVVRSDPPPAPPPSSSSKLLSALASGDRKSTPESRLQVRYAVELELGFQSDSNFWVGFTENLSASGVFVATYAGRAIGSRITLTMNFPNGDTVVTEGVVRWTRAASTDGWPGMGVQFDGIKPEDEAKIRKFLSVREPLFYDV